MAFKTALAIEEIDASFCEWGELLDLLHSAFEYQKGRVDPPSSLYGLDVQLIEQKAGEERAFVARNQGRLVGCVFAKDTGTSIYLGKLAVLPQFQGKGVGRLLVQTVETIARQCGRAILELETRIELIENRQVFESYGFVKVRESAHPGYDHTTSITMEKRIDT